MFKILSIISSVNYLRYTEISMTKKTRTILFLICLFLFLLAAPLIIFYAQGYRFDTESKKITQTGGLFLKVIPKSVEIYLDYTPPAIPKIKKKTDFFFGTALIENLLPKKYEIKVVKEGYYPWEKNLEIREKEVAEAKNVVLIPENPNFIILTNEVEDFFFSPDGKKIILKATTSPPSGDEKSWALKLYDLERKVKSHLINKDDISPEEVELFDLKFSPDSKKISLEVAMKEQLKYFTLEIDKSPPLLTKEEKKSLPFFENTPVYQIVGENVYYLDNSGYLFKTDLTFEPKEKITEIAFPVKKETDYELNIGRRGDGIPEYIFLRESQILHRFNPEIKSFEKFFEPIKNLKISPDYNKIVYFSNYEIWILFLKEITGQPKRQSGEQLFLIRLSEKIDDVFWFNSNYLVFNTADIIKIAEIDDRDRINIVDLGLPDTSQGKTKKIFWNQFDKRLYVLSEGNLYQSKKLLP